MRRHLCAAALAVASIVCVTAAPASAEARTASTPDAVTFEQAQLYGHLAWMFGIGFRLHECEQGGTVNEWHPGGASVFASNGMGMMGDLYWSVTGRSGWDDPPELQIAAAYLAKVEQGAQWGGSCRAIANEWLG